MKDETTLAISRRSAIAKLAKMSAYTAPTVTAILISQSYAVGSCLAGGDRLSNGNSNAGDKMLATEFQDRRNAADVGAGGANGTGDACP